LLHLLLKLLLLTGIYKQRNDGTFHNNRHPEVYGLPTEHP